ncbi:MAG: SusC/RagA family TonB-linked outer membrane protein, partial [Bacteroidetes bacterium]|nr:SusC/RagA family TonB-linked outer membrane protein [Bacteroidota bacterium]
KALTLSVNAYLQLGGKKLLPPAYSLVTNLPTEYENLSRQLLARWTPQNTSAAFPGLPDANSKTNFLLPDGKTYTNFYEMYNYSTARVVDASTLRFNSIFLSYSLPAKLVSRVKLKGISLNGGVSNPFAIVSRDFKGRDSEVAMGNQPRTRTYSMTFNITF